MSALQQWDAAVRAYRKMLADRPLGMFYSYPDPPLPPELTALGPHRPRPDNPSAFITLRRGKTCACGGRSQGEPCDPTCISWESTYQEREGE